MPAYPQTAVPPALALPVIEDAFPRNLHPYWPKLQEKTRSWLLEKRLMPADKVEKYADGLCYTDLMAGYYMGAPNEVLAAICDYSAWFFVWDDRHDRDVIHGRTTSWRRLAVQLHAATEAPQLHLRHKDPLVAAFAESVDRLYGSLSRTWSARFARHFHVVIDAYDQEFHNRMTGTVPSVDEYISLRRNTFAHWIWLDLLEPTAQYELPAWVRKNAAFTRAALACQDFAAWYNDLCSLPKELAGDELHNLGISLIKHEGLSLQEAIVEVRRRVQGTIEEFLAAEVEVEQLAVATENIGPHGRELATAIRSCVGNMRNWFSSVYWFHHESGRYAVDSWDDRSTPPYVTDDEPTEQTNQVGECA
ncbi:terpene synthase family protein [Streptomyces sp. cg35]|uniref:terpene synthase family protein n=1 Tax=Streptomyces sp. cg35 TaxID=3421650 RepID=UPI003D171D29